MSACIPADRLVQTLLVQVPGVTNDMLNIQMFNVIDEFLRRTNAWKEDADVDLEVGVPTYGMPVPAGTSLIRVIGVSHNGQPLVSAGAGITRQSIGKLTPEEIFPDGDTSYEPSETDLAAGTFSYAVYAPEYITTSVATDEEAVKYPLKVTMALSIGSTCLEFECGDWAIPEWMWDTYFQSWLDGTLSRLYAMPAKPWSSAVLGVYHGKKFRSTMAFHKQEAQRGFTYATPNWRFPRRGWV